MFDTTGTGVEVECEDRKTSHIRLVVHYDIGTVRKWRNCAVIARKNGLESQGELAKNRMHILRPLLGLIECVDEHAAGGEDVFAPAATDGGGDALVREIIAEANHLLLV